LRECLDSSKMRNKLAWEYKSKFDQNWKNSEHFLAKVINMSKNKWAWA
jgi:hypothetical protein